MASTLQTIDRCWKASSEEAVTKPLEMVAWHFAKNVNLPYDLPPLNSISGKDSPPVEWDMEGGLMARKRYTEEQIMGVLNEAEAGAKTGELCRKHGMSEAAFYKWKAKYAGLTLNEV